MQSLKPGEKRRAAGRVIKESWLEDAAYEAHRLAATTHPVDVKHALGRALARESVDLPKFVLQSIVENSSVAEADQRPICADVGVLRVFAVAGNEALLETGFVGLERAVRRATVRVTQDLALRSNRVHPITRRNPGNNLGVFAPNLDYRFEPDADWVELIAVHKGGAFGSDFRMMVDGDGMNGVRKGLIDAIAEFGRRGLTCPPVIIGVGIGGTKDQAFSIAKQAAVLRPIGDRHPEAAIAELEDELQALANSLGLSAMGYPGTGDYALDVHVEIAYTHSALTPLGIHQICQAARRGVIRVHADGTLERRDAPAWFSAWSRREGV
ncbi:MAG: fumarate hydratase [Proteobacteria bacterium]|nr:fumarate hydratase [Pseudomonadota bacterium]